MNLVDSSNFFISYRKEGDDCSSFLNVSNALTSEDVEKIYCIYKNIFLSVNSFDPSKIDEVKEMERKFYLRIKLLIQIRNAFGNL
jgi:hypothetical protein